MIGQERSTMEGIVGKNPGSRSVASVTNKSFEVEALPGWVKGRKRSIQNRHSKSPKDLYCWEYATVEPIVKAGIINCIDSEISKFLCQSNSILLK
jgi:hypothetical protein